jgi:hypothetical protein
MVVVTPWDPSTCQLLADAIEADPEGISSPIRWVRLAPWDDPAHLLDRNVGVDLLLGWPEATLELLERRGLLAPGGADPNTSAGWVLVSGPADVEGTPPADPPTSIADPRIVPGSRMVVSRIFHEGDWAVGYARLLRMGRGSSDFASGIPVEQWGAIPFGSGHPEAARLLVIIASGAGLDGPSASPESPIEPGLIVVQAELIGATVIDSAKELRDAWQAIEQSTDADSMRSELVEPPPWPPASIQDLRADPSRRSLLGTLAEALVKDRSAREWLISSWESPARPIDRATLIELATVAEGRLIEEPQFLPWLRAEWTAWARQRFDRIGRTGATEGGGPR